MNQRNSQKANKAYFDNVKRLHPQSQLLQPGDMVLLFDSTSQRSRGVKLKDKWRGPFQITEKAKKSTFYLLAELDGTPFAKNIAGNRLKKFYSRDVMKLLKEPKQFDDETSPNADDEGGNIGGYSTIEKEEMGGKF